MSILLGLARLRCLFRSRGAARGSSSCQVESAIVPSENSACSFDVEKPLRRLLAPLPGVLQRIRSRWKGGFSGKVTRPRDARTIPRLDCDTLLFPLGLPQVAQAFFWIDTAPLVSGLLYDERLLFGQTTWTFFSRQKALDRPPWGPAIRKRVFQPAIDDAGPTSYARVSRAPHDHHRHAAARRSGDGPR